MKAMVVKKSLFSSTLEQREVKISQVKDNDVLIKVCATGVNRGDIIDVATSNDGVCPGLECSGIIEAVGRNVSCWKVGERVCALLEGGGYAEQVVVPADCLLPLPDDIALDEAAALPYASCSIWSGLFEMCGPGTLNDKLILIREGSSGIGALAIQYAKYMGLTVLASAGSREKFPVCRHYGADACFDHTMEKFELAVKNFNYKGVDFVLDYGACNLSSNIMCCRSEAKIVILDLHGKQYGELDIGKLQRNHAKIKVFDLRYRDLSYKASAVAKMRAHLWPFILQHKLIPIVEHRFPMIEAQQALCLLKKNDSTGKIIVSMDFEKAGKMN